MAQSEPSEISDERPVENSPAEPEAPRPVEPPEETREAQPAQESAPSPAPSAPDGAAAGAAPGGAALAGVVVDAQPGPRAATGGFWAQPGWLALGMACLLTALLSMILTLGVLAAANGGLVYASPSQVLALQSRLDGLQTRVETQEQDLAGMRSRLDAVEKLAGRTTTLEQAAQTLRSELDKRAAELDTLRGAVEGAQKQLTQMVTQSAAFETFISGMRNLLDSIALPGGTKP